MQPEPETELDKLPKIIRESENILRGIRLAAVVDGIDVGQCKCRMIDMMEDLLLKISAPTQHQKQDLQLHFYLTGDTSQPDWNMQDFDPQESRQSIINNTMGYGIGRAAGIVNVVPERGGVAMSARANQYDNSNTLQLMGSEFVLNVRESSIYAVGSFSGNICETVQGSNTGTQAEYPGFCSDLSTNFSDGLREETHTHHNLQNQDRLEFAHESATNARMSTTASSTDQNPYNGHATTSADGPYTSYLQHLTYNFNGINMGTTIGSKISRDGQSIAVRWATKWEAEMNQNRKVNEAVTESLSYWKYRPWRVSLTLIFSGFCSLLQPLEATMYYANS
jgi:hypothetical protein